MHGILACACRELCMKHHNQVYECKALTRLHGLLVRSHDMLTCGAYLGCMPRWLVHQDRSEVCDLGAAPDAQNGVSRASFPAVLGVIVAAARILVVAETGSGTGRSTTNRGHCDSPAHSTYRLRVYSRTRCQDRAPIRRWGRYRPSVRS